MHSRRRFRQVGLRLRRCLIVGLVFASYVTAALGIPCPSSVHKDTRVPFPCQNRPCGCQNAEQCWKHCCCFTAEEKLAWASAHQVEPPTSAQPREPQPQAAHESSCCCSGTCELETPEASTPPAAPPSTHERPSSPTPAGSWVLGMMARQCQEYGSSWLTSQPAVPPPPFLSWSQDRVSSDWFPPTPSLLRSLATPPASPPPRS